MAAARFVRLLLKSFTALSSHPRETPNLKSGFTNCGPLPVSRRPIHPFSNWPIASLHNSFPNGGRRADVRSLILFLESAKSWQGSKSGDLHCLPTGHAPAHPTSPAMGIRPQSPYEHSSPRDGDPPRWGSVPHPPLIPHPTSLRSIRAHARLMKHSSRQGGINFHPTLQLVRRKGGSPSASLMRVSFVLGLR